MYKAKSIEDMKLGFEKIINELNRLEKSYSLDLTDLRSKTELTIRRLNATEAVMIESGIHYDGGCSLAHISKILGISSRERVRQIESKAIKELKTPKNSIKLKKYLYNNNSVATNYCDINDFEIELYDDSTSRCELESLLYVNVMGGSPYDAVKHGRIKKC